MNFNLRSRFHGPDLNVQPKDPEGYLLKSRYFQIWRSGNPVPGVLVPNHYHFLRRYPDHYKEAAKAFELWWAIARLTR